MKLTILFFFPFFISVTPLFAQERDTPNIIYILADDMGIGDVKAYNSEANSQHHISIKWFVKGLNLQMRIQALLFVLLQDMGFLLEDMRGEHI